MLRRPNLQRCKTSIFFQQEIKSFCNSILYRPCKTMIPIQFWKEFISIKSVITSKVKKILLISLGFKLLKRKLRGKFCWRKM